MSNIPTTGSTTASAPVHHAQELRQDTFVPDVNIERKLHDQWFYERVFEDLHMYFAQENAIEYTNPLTNQEWLTTPPIKLLIGDKPVTLVAAVPIGKYKLSPIEFFVDRCDGIPVGRLSTTELFTQQGALEYEIRGVTHEGVDFSKVTGDELHAFTDSLTDYLINNPDKGVVAQAAELIGDVAVGVAASALDKATKAGETISEVWNREKYYNNLFFYGMVKSRNIIMGVGAGLVVAGVGGTLLVKHLAAPSYYDTPHSLPAASAINPNSNSFQDVQVLSDAEIKKLEGADVITSLDEIKTKKGKPVSTFEGQITDTDRVGDVLEAQVPQDGQCNLVQTFNIPKGTVHMVQSDGLPRLIVRVQKVTGYLEDNSTTGITRVDEGSSDTRTAELTQVQVCNPRDKNAVDFEVAEGEHAYLQFVSEAPARFLEGPGGR